MKKLLVALILSGTVLLSGCSNPSTPAGHEGYVKESPRVWGNGGFKGA
jgi:PBP1b-binding outer membrane lipoprotein LpoB